MLPQKRKADKPGRGAPVPGQALGPGAGEAGRGRRVPQVRPIPVPVLDPRVVEQVQPVPGVAGAVGHHAHGVPVDVQAVPVGLGHDGRAGGGSHGVR